MKPSTICPICDHEDTKSIHTHAFTPTKRHLLSESSIPQDISSDDERLWIFFNKIAHSKEEVLIKMLLCNHCGFIYGSPRLTNQDINIKYTTLNQLGFDKKRHLESPAHNMKERSERVYKFCAPHLPTNTSAAKKNILDYGGAEGELLLPFIEKGHNGFLVDYIDYPNADKRISYLGKDHNDIADDLQFDLILFLHTLEHVVDPIQLIANLKSKLKPGGIIYIEVPLGAWMEWKYLREPITHVNFFSEQSLYYCLQRNQLDVSAIETNWQWVTHSKTPCINIIGKNQIDNETASITPKSTAQQMQAFSQFAEALKVNSRYYGKLMVKSWLKLK